MKIVKKLLSYIPEKMGIPLLICLFVNLFAFYVPRIFTSSLEHYFWNLKIDEYFKLVPWTVVIYFGCYIFWGISYILAVYQPKEEAYRFLSAHFLAETVCFVIFLIFPTEIERPMLENKTVWDTLMHFLYASDNPDNLFPSLHCLVSWFCCIGVRKNKKVHLWYKIFAHIFTLAICISTLTTKQHVFVDTVAGIALAEFCYQITNVIGFTGLYEKCICKIQSIKLFQGVSRK